MSIKKLAYNGSSKILKNVVTAINALIDQGGGGGSTVSWTQIQQTGTKIAEIDIDGASQDVYAPNGGGSSTLADLTDVNLTSLTNGQIIKYNSTSQKWENANESGGGGGELYLDNGLIGSDSGVYVTCNLDKALVNGFYIVRVYDSSNGAVGWYNLKWDGTTQTLSVLSGGQLQITSTTAGLTYYSGNWRNIYCDILSLGSGGGGGGSDHHYSTSEQKIGFWIDDRPVYEKTIIVPGPFSNNQISVAHGITDLDDVINYRGFFRNRGSNYNERRFVPQLYYNDMQYIISLYHITDTDMLIVYGNWLRQYATVSDIYIILQYTKTTD